jgi:hypothetical protein
MDSLTTVANRHDFDTTFTAEFDKNKSAVTIITPDSGKRVKVVAVQVSTEGASAVTGKVRVYFATSADTIATIYPGTGAAGNVSVKDIIVEGAIDEAVKMTSDLGDDKNFYISVSYQIVS